MRTRGPPERSSRDSRTDVLKSSSLPSSSKPTILGYVNLFHRSIVDILPVFGNAFYKHPYSRKHLDAKFGD